MNTLLLLAADPTPVRMMGKIIGGWEYIYAAYAITWLGIALYATSLFLRRRKQ